MNDVTETPQARSARAAAAEACREELAAAFRNVLHVNIHDARSLSELNATLDWAYRKRRAEEGAARWARLTVVGLVVSGLAGLIVAYFKG